MVFMAIGVGEDHILTWAKKKLFETVSLSAHMDDLLGMLDEIEASPEPSADAAALTVRSQAFGGQSIKETRDGIEQLAKQGSRATVMRPPETISLKDSTKIRVNKIVKTIVYCMEQLPNAKYCCTFTATLVEIEKVKRKISIYHAERSGVLGSEKRKSEMGEGETWMIAFRREATLGYRLGRVGR